MKTPNEILTELQGIAPLLTREDISRSPYVVPRGFFEGFAENLMKRIHLEAIEFSESESGQKIAEVSPLLEISEISPLLAGLKNKNPYKVPTGYFEELKATIPTPEIKIVEIKSKRTPVFNLKFTKYAVAACLVALLGTAIFSLAYHKTSDPIKDLTNVSDQDIANYLDSNDVHWTPGISSSSVSTDFNENDVQDLLSGVPDEELEQYSTSLPDDKRNVN
jgi:hypothetical protein